MAKRARPEEESIEATSEKVEDREATVSKGETVAVKVWPITVGRPGNEGETGTPKEVAASHVAVDEMPGDGPFWELLALAGYMPW